MDLEQLSSMLRSMSLGEVTSEEFMKATEQARSLTNMDPDTQLLLYANYKQATEGNITAAEPSDQNSPAYYKWKAWKTLYGFPMEDERRAYVYFVQQATGGDGKQSGQEFSMGSITSTLYVDYYASQTWSEQEALHKAVQQHDLPALQQLLANNNISTDLINLQDETGRTALHHACDSGDLESVKLLLSVSGISAQIRDHKGNTPLMYAIICEHLHIIDLLLKVSNSEITAEVLNLIEESDQQTQIEAFLLEHNRMDRIVERVEKSVGTS